MTDESASKPSDHIQVKSGSADRLVSTECWVDLIRYQ
jgi:hypothetical protein